MFAPGIFKGQRILITGGGTGLGREMAAKFLILGADLYICGRRKGVVDQTAAELMAAHGGSVKAYQVDIKDAPAVDTMIQWIWDDGGPLTGFRVGGLFYAGVQGLSPGTKTGLDWEEEDGRAVELSKTA